MNTVMLKCDIQTIVRVLFIVGAGMLISSCRVAQRGPWAVGGANVRLSDSPDVDKLYADTAAEIVRLGFKPLPSPALTAEQKSQGLTCMWALFGTGCDHVSLFTLPEADGREILLDLDESADHKHLAYEYEERDHATGQKVPGFSLAAWGVVVKLDDFMQLSTVSDDEDDVKTWGKPD